MMSMAISPGLDLAGPTARGAGLYYVHEQMSIRSRRSILLFRHYFVPSVGRPNPMREHRYQPSVGRAVNRSLSFSASCELHRLRLAYGTRDAKELGFNHVRRSQTYSDWCWDKRESVAHLSVETC